MVVLKSRAKFEILSGLVAFQDSDFIRPNAKY